MPKILLITGAVFMLLAVAIGAFGAHGLESTLEANARKETFETGVKYHFYHALGILIVCLLYMHVPNPLLKTAAWFMVGGIVIFSGSLYVLSIANVSILGAITPLGGVAFLIAWSLVAYSILKADGV